MGTFSHAYARFAHIDAQDEKSEVFCRKMLRERYGLSEAEAGVGALDVVMLNVWKPYDRTVEQNPLAILDCASLAEKDVVVTTYAGNGGGSERNKMSQVTESAAHKWLYWPKMGTEEALIFKQYDTRKGAAQCSFHNSFHDPFYDSDPNTPGRRSCEFRMLCTFPVEKQGDAPAAKL